MKVYLIIVAGGKGLRMGSAIPKQYIELNNKPIILHTAENLIKSCPQAKLLIVLPKGDFSFWETLCAKHNFNFPHKLIEGGAERYHSVQNALNTLSAEPNDVVGIHDAVRPFVSEQTVLKAVESAKLHKSGIPVVELKDSIRKVSEKGSTHKDRSKYKLVQTPQCFNLQLLKEAFSSGYQAIFTDDASVFENYGQAIFLTDGNVENIKITSPFDLKIAQNLFD